MNLKLFLTCILLAWGMDARAAVNCNGKGAVIIGNYYVGEGSVGDTATASGYHYAEVIFNDGACSDRMYFPDGALWSSVLNAKTGGNTISVDYCDGCTGGVTKTFGTVVVSARMDAATPGSASCHVSVKGGNVTDLKRFLQSMDHCTIGLEGTFSGMNSALTVSKKTELLLDGQNSIWKTGAAFNWVVNDSREFVIRNVSIQDSASQTTLFEFNHSQLCGLDGITYYGTSAGRDFSVFKNGSDHGSVQNCNIRNVRSGIKFGVEAPEKYPPYSQPVTEPSASFCLAENNFISDFVSQAIATRASTNMQGVDPSLLFMRQGSIIRGNTISNPNVNRTTCPQGNHGCSIGIEVWGGDVVVESNVITSDPSAYVNTGISLAYGYGISCRNNIIKGGYNYQGIELQEVDYSTISGNYVENVSSPTDALTAGIGVSVDAILSSTARCVKNTLSKNKIVNCKRGILLDEASTVKTVMAEDTLINDGYGFWTWGENFEMRNCLFQGNAQGLYLGAGAASGEPSLISGNTFKNTAGSVIWNDNDQSGSRGRPYVFSGNTVEGWGNATYPEAVMFRCGPSTVKGNTFKADSRNYSGWTPVIAVKRPDSYHGRYAYVLMNNGIGSGVALSVPWWMGDMIPVSQASDPFGVGSYPASTVSGNYNF